MNYDSILQPRIIQRMRDGLVARRHLPPGTELGRPARPDQRALLVDLLAAPDSIDPVRWLQEERGDIVARLTLQEVLQVLKREYEVARTNLRGGDLPLALQDIRRDLDQAWTIPVTAAEDLFAGFEGEEIDPALLRGVLRRVRTVRPRYSGPQGLMPSGDLPRLIDDLLQLPDGVDPLNWLQTERADLGAVLRLHDLLRASSPPRGLSTGDHPRRDYPRQRISFPGRAEFVIEEIALGDNGFSVEITVRTFWEDLPRPLGIDLLIVWWDGFERVSDSNGYQYIPSATDQSARSGYGDAYRLHMSFYPGIAPDATELIFSSNPATVSVMGLGRQGVEFLPELVLGDVEWRVAVER